MSDRDRRVVTSRRSTSGSRPARLAGHPRCGPGIALLLALLAYPGSAPTPATAEINRVVLRVNERIATTHDYERRRDERLQALQRAEGLSAEERQELLADLGTTIMANLLEEMLILSRADQLGIRADEEQVDRAVEQSKAGLGITTEEQFQQALSASGITAEELRGQMRRNLLMQEIMGREVQPRVALEEEDLRRYYQSHSDEFQVPERLLLEEVVVLESSGLGPIRMSAVAAEIRQKVVDGGELGEVTAPYAEDGTTSGVIELGWIEAGDLDQGLEEAVWGLSEGELSAPVPGRGGLHLLRLVERDEARLQSFNEVQEQIARREQEMRFQQEVEKYMQELQTSSYIVAHPPPEAAGFSAELGRAQEEELPGFSAAAAAMVEAGTDDAGAAEADPEPGAEAEVPEDDGER